MFLFHDEQFSFTKDGSTVDAGVELLKNIYEAWGKTFGVFCDMSKAFVCVHFNT